MSSDPRSNVHPVQLPGAPDVWGEGALFAFSGVDGPTNTISGFVASLGLTPGWLHFHTPIRRVMNTKLPDDVELTLITGDVIAGMIGEQPFVITFAAWHTLVGFIPVDEQPLLAVEGGKHARQVDDNTFISTAADDAFALVCNGQRFSLTYGDTEAQALQRAVNVNYLDPFMVTQERLAFLRQAEHNHLAAPQSENSQLRNKCLSVMKVNTLGAEGAITGRWSAPDRIARCNMGLWDTVFHSLGMNHIDPDLAWSYLQTMLDQQDPDGKISGYHTTGGIHTRFTQPPLLAWGIWQNFQYTQNKERLSLAAPVLARYLEWNLANRDQNGNHLLTWGTSGNADGPAMESGMGNSPRFDDAQAAEAVDFSVYQANDMLCLSRIYQAIGNAPAAADWSERAAIMRTVIHAMLWHEEDGLYYDRVIRGSHTRLKTNACFLPLLLPDIPADRVERLTAHLMNPTTFAAAVPVPSVAQDEPSFSTDLWAGPVWLSTNALIVHGLRERGQSLLAKQITARTIAIVQKYYEQRGVLFAYYDAKDERSPDQCDCYGSPPDGYDPRNKEHSTRDFHPTAALTFHLLQGQ